MTKISRFHVVLLPTDIQRESLVGLSEKLNIEGSNLVVLGTGALPHITLYNPEIPDGNRQSGYEIVEQFAQGFPITRVMFNKFYPAPEDDTGLFIEYKITTELETIRLRLVNSLQEVHQGIVRERWRGSSLHKDEIDHFGYPVSRYHFPHVTLAKFQSIKDRDNALEELKNQGMQDFSVKSIAIVETGDHGTAKRIIKEFLV